VRWLSRGIVHSLNGKISDRLRRLFGSDVTKWKQRSQPKLHIEKIGDNIFVCATEKGQRVSPVFYSVKEATKWKDGDGDHH